MSSWIGFSTPKKQTVLTRLIRTLTKSSVSHAFLLYFDTDWQIPVVMEAMSHGMRLIPYETWLKKNNTLHLVSPKHAFEATERQLAEMLGQNYDVSGLLGFSWVLLGRWLHRTWKNPLQSDKALFCSEAIARAMQLANYPKADILDPSATDPKTLLEFFKDE